MSYIEEFEKELDRQIRALDEVYDPASVVAWASEKVLESYRNGVAARKQAHSESVRRGLAQKRRGREKAE